MFTLQSFNQIFRLRNIKTAKEILMKAPGFIDSTYGPA